MSETRTRAERKEHTRQRLLDVTLKMITNRSLSSISLREVARAAGIVPTAFYRHFDSIDALGVELVDECMRPLRQMVREARRGVALHGDIITGTVDTLGRQVRSHPEQFRFLVRERYGGVHGVRRAIDAELRLFTSELTVDLARLTAGYDWSTDDLEMTAVADGERDARRRASTCSRSTSAARTWRSTRCSTAPHASFGSSPSA